MSWILFWMLLLLVAFFIGLFFFRLKAKHGVRLSTIVIVVIVALFAAWVFWIAKGFDLGTLLYISEFCGLGLLFSWKFDKTDQEIKQRKELEQREQQEKEREQQRVTQLRAKYGNSLPQLSTFDGKALISEYLATLPENSTEKRCVEICQEILPELTPVRVSGFCRLLKQDGLIGNREINGKFYWFSLIRLETAEKRQNIYQQLEQQRLEKEAQWELEQKAQQELEELNQKRQELNREVVASMDTVDKMDGHQFEHYCAGLLRKLNFTNVEVTKGSGDQGVDIVAVKEGVRYAIQCKCYSSSLGNSPVQEVNAGKQLYGCHVAVVLTNQHFTSGAKTLAAATGVLLWDRDELERMIKRAGGGK